MSKRQSVSIRKKIRAHRLVLIDGHAILHRAYHALPPLTILDRPSRNML